MTSTTADILSIFTDFTNEKGKQKNKINFYAVRQILQSGKEITPFVNHRKRSYRVKNPIESFQESGRLSRQEAYAAKQYQLKYNISNLNNYASPSYEVRSSSSSSKELISVSQIEASKWLYDFHQVVAGNNFYINRHRKEVSKRYFEILENIFQKEKSVQWCCENLKMSHSTIARLTKEICNLILNF